MRTQSPTGHHTRWDFTLIANPVAEKGKAAVIAEKAYRRLTGQGLKGVIEFTTQPGDANRIARAIAQNGGRWIIACGGDGTVHEIVNAIAEQPDVVLGMLPCGKGNDLAAALKIPKSLASAVDVLLYGVTRQIDLGKIGNRYFDTIVTCGYDSEVNRRVAVEGAPFSGTLSYVYTAITTLFSFESPSARVEGDFGVYDGGILLTATGNTRRYGGGLKILPDAVLDDGLLDVCIIKPVPRRTVLCMMISLFWGGHTSHPAVRIHRTKSLTIHADPPILLFADGEQVCYTPATIQVVERGLTALASPKAR